MARNRQRAKARKAKARDQAQSPGTQEALASELSPTTAPPDPIAEASGAAELAKATEVAAAEPVEDGAELVDETELEELEVEDAQERENGGKPAGAGEALPKSGNRLLNFFRACWAELRRVQWPDRRQVSQATGVVLGFVIIAGSFLGLADYAMSKLVDVIL